MFAYALIHSVELPEQMSLGVCEEISEKICQILYVYLLHLEVFYMAFWSVSVTEKYYIVAKINNSNIVDASLNLLTLIVSF